MPMPKTKAKMHISRSAKRVSDGLKARLTNWPRAAAEYAAFCLRLPASLNGNAAFVPYRSAQNCNRSALASATIGGATWNEPSVCSQQSIYRLANI